MRREYLCPSCGGVLNPGTKVVFVIEHGASRALLLLSPRLGDYGAVVGRGLVVTPGEAYRFSCLICHADLTSPHDPHLVQVLSRLGDGAPAVVAFSRIAGEHATFLQDARGLHRFGEHAARYQELNFFGAGHGPQE